MAAAKASAATKTFKELSDKLPYSPTTQNGRGFLPPFLRALGHLLYGLGRAEESKGKDKDTFSFLEGEVKDAIEHLGNVEVNSAFSKTTQDQLLVLNQAMTAYQKEYAAWTEEDKIGNLKSLVNKAMGVASNLDRELAGIRNSDPGSAL